MPTIRFTEDLQQWEEGYELAKHASERLPGVLDRYQATVESEWGRDEDDKGQPLVTLRLKDSIGEVIGKMDTEELRSHGQTSFRLNRLMGNLLRIHTDELMKSLQISES